MIWPFFCKGVFFLNPSQKGLEILGVSRGRKNDKFGKGRTHGKDK